MRHSGLPLESGQLRWRCDEAWLEFDSTAEVDPVAGIVGQDDAVEALRFGLEIAGAGQNVYIRGLVGTGRMSLVRQLLERSTRGANRSPDRCYVHDFDQPDRPRLVSLAPGQGRGLRDAVQGLVGFIEEQLADALSSEAVRARRRGLDEQAQAEIAGLGKPFEEELRSNDLALVTVTAGQVAQPAIAPIVDGKPVSYSELEERRIAGSMTDARITSLQEKVERFGRRLADLNHRIHEVQLRHQDRLKSLYVREARELLDGRVAGMKSSFPVPEVHRFLDALLRDLVENRLGDLDSVKEYTRAYRVNLIRCSEPEDSRPIVIENTPTQQNLLGSIERDLIGTTVLRSDHLMIRGGSLLRADGGFLVMEAREVLGEPGAWRALMRTLRSGKLEIVPSEFSMLASGPLLKPDAIELDVKVILIGEPGLHAMLDAHDPDFPNQFKVLADFESTIARDRTGVRYYAGILARIARDESLPAFTRAAVAALAEHGARIAGRRDRLTTRFGRLADIAREAAYLARKESSPAVNEQHVRRAVARGRHRADLPARNFRKLVADGSIRIETEGAVVGQINGLAVVHAGPLTYGFPTRITATIGPGSAGTVNIEREAELSGAIHTKGFYILGGLLRHLLRTRHPLAFSASIAFEQSYGGIDGDSASGAEMCCLMSALTDVPLDQGIAMTGAIDQLGHIQPIGAVSEKVDGFFAVCQAGGLTGRQGVLVPSANVGDLMVDHAVVAACERGEFHVHAADTIFDALSLLTGETVSDRDAHGNYPEGSLLARAEIRAREFWRMASGSGERDDDRS